LGKARRSLVEYSTSFPSPRLGLSLRRISPLPRQRNLFHLNLHRDPNPSPNPNPNPRRHRR
jgi:hypothetical protein